MSITLSFTAPAGLRPDWPAGTLALGDLAPSPEVVSIPEPTALAAVAGASAFAPTHVLGDVTPSLGQLGQLGQLGGRHVRHSLEPAADPSPTLATIHSVVLGEHAWLVIDASLDSSGAPVDPLPVLTDAEPQVLDVDALARTSGVPLPSVADLLVLLGAAAARTGLTLDKTGLPADQSQAQTADLTVTGLGGSPVRGQPCVVVVTTTPKP